MTVPEGTADGSISFDEVILSLPVSHWVARIDAEFVAKNGWKPRTLAPGTYGYDNYAHAINAAAGLIDCRRDRVPDREAVAKYIHMGWKRNYEYWRDEEPWEDTSRGYTKPFQPLGDERRETCARLPWHELDQTEKDKDLSLADIIMGIAFDECTGRM